MLLFIPLLMYDHTLFLIFIVLSIPITNCKIIILKNSLIVFSNSISIVLDHHNLEEISSELNLIYGERLREINRTHASFMDTHGFCKILTATK